ncbi:endocuticle structural glycoprotein ABD-5-like [Periplaneta americana]|uniref:endocuticle structural glycoprotein ABD-5-like n=1 Tax=Periplaneta americana TaxID=6978 RepID=UPI0037E7CC2B
MEWVLLLGGLLVLGIASAAPQDATILSYQNNISPEGYDFAFETSDGISRSETGILKNAGTDNEILEVMGRYLYMGSDGQPYMVAYIANENGYQQKKISPALAARTLSLKEILAG